MFRKNKLKILLLCALAIALTLTLPRLAIILFVKFNTTGQYNNLDATGSDLLLKFLFSYFVALTLLWLNTGISMMHIRRLKVDLNKFYQRFLMNIFFYIVIKWIGTYTLLPATALAANARFSGFLFNISLILEIILCILTSEIYRLIVNNQAIRVRNEALQKDNAERTFEALKNQVNPHFLFNSLNTIQAMIGRDDEAARSFTTNMAEVYRHILTNSDKALITLQQELEAIHAYAAMLRERHGDNLKIQLDISEDLLQHYLPPASVQILLENAVKHNIVSVSQPLVVNISAGKEILTVSNDLQERTTKVPSTGTGLYNLERRYNFIANKEIIISKGDQKFSVKLPLLKSDQIVISS